ncbi:GNAT family N-acetyltransferase [Pullulanibacillus sp. KACC 23026]|uniref:GNAT family N-acetyltransferase n=1 Tax=Pullulanibacillus sp. KACC 23026 TaxID=3028315 RepID=UPI0023AF601C|nr:GNAT family N-acetyltransferase [Pullulanibacillus sp. KACC 23026]WEG14506.1 GNAT family N-acetyltransferase [Pullulanibacillus sp. KACC 23026]
MSFEYITFKSVPEGAILESLLLLHKNIFGESDNLIKDMESKSNILILAAINDSKVIGYKIGYDLDHTKFYSWLGGVDNHFRKHGVGSKLMETQHQYLKENGYKIVQTKSMNKWRNMLLLNIKTGFDVVGTELDKNGEIKIILEKPL